jgi:hypothetical protein
MARTNHVLPITMIAMSPTKVAAATALDYRGVVLPAIFVGELGPVYRIGHRRRLLIADVEKWLRRFPHHAATTTKKVS